MDEAVRRLVLSRPIPERLIAELEVAPLVAPHEVNEALYRIKHVPARIGRNQFGYFHRRMPRLRTRPDKDTPTPRQLRALELYASGLLYKQVGAAMDPPCAENTVKDHLKCARAALRASTTAHAVAIAIRRGLIN